MSGIWPIPIQISELDSQFLKSHSHETEKILQSFGVPSYLLCGITGGIIKVKSRQEAFESLEEKCRVEYESRLKQLLWKTKEEIKNPRNTCPLKYNPKTDVFLVCLGADLSETLVAAQEIADQTLTTVAFDFNGEYHKIAPKD